MVNNVIVTEDEEITIAFKARTEIETLFKYDGPKLLIISGFGPFLISCFLR